MVRDEYLANFNTNMDKVGWDPLAGGGKHEVSILPPSEDSVDNNEFVTVCEICDVQLDRFGLVGDDPQWIHGRRWMSFDHDPVPKQVPRTVRRVGLCDFCGHEGYTYWVFIGDRVVQDVGNMRNDQGHKFGSCADCAPLVWTKDTDAVLDRIMRRSPTARGRDRRQTAIVRAELAKQIVPYVHSVHSREYVGPPPEVSRLDPRLMPKIRDGLVKLWHYPAVAARFRDHRSSTRSIPGVHAGDEDEFRRLYQPGEVIPEQVFQAHRDHLVAGLYASDLYWISPDFTTLAIAAGQELDNVSLTREELPSTFGLVIWAAPIGEIERPYGVAAVRAISWTLVPGGVWINVYFQVEDADPTSDALSLREQYGWLMTPNPGSGIIFGEHDYRKAGEGWLGGKDNFVATLLATWFLMNQPGVAASTSAPPDKALTRSYRRAGRQMPDVKLVDLRRHAHARPQDAENDAERRRLSVRFMVRGHWKRQAYGPARSLRKSIYISPFTKGPDDAPFKTPSASVKVLR